jgi:hypothetical protein
MNQCHLERGDPGYKSRPEALMVELTDEVALDAILNGWHEEWPMPNRPITVPVPVPPAPLRDILRLALEDEGYLP